MAVPEGLTMDKVYEERMLNTSFSMKKVETCFELAIGKFNRDMATLAALPEFGFEAQQVYISTFDINKALTFQYADLLTRGNEVRLDRRHRA